jgi:hypothetical protein
MDNLVKYFGEKVQGAGFSVLSFSKKLVVSLLRVAG